MWLQEKLLCKKTSDLISEGGEVLPIGFYLFRVSLHIPTHPHPNIRSSARSLDNEIRTELRRKYMLRVSSSSDSDDFLSEVKRKIDDFGVWS